MIGATFTVKDKQYTLLKDLTMGEYRKISRANSKVNKVSKLAADEGEKITRNTASEFAEASDDQLQIICDFLEQYVGISEEDLNNLGMEDAILVFQEAFKLASTPDKDIKKT